MSWTDLGTSTSVAGASKFLTGGQGATLTAATTITITDGMHQVDGSATIQTINGGEPNTALLLYRPTGATWALGASGNIKASSSTPTERIIFLSTPDGTTWYGDSQGVSVASANTDISVAESGGTYTLTFNPANVTLDEFTGPLAISKGGTGQTAQDEAFDALAPTTTRGDLIRMGSAGDNTRLAVGGAGSVLTSDGNDPVWDDTPTVTTITCGAASAAAPGIAVNGVKGLYEIGTNELGFAIAGTGELSLDATDLSPVTNAGLDLGALASQWKSAYAQDDRGYRDFTLASGANTVATFPVPTNDGVAVEIVGAALATGTGPNYSLKTLHYHLTAYNNAGTLVVAASSAGVTSNSQTASGTFNFNTLTAALTDAGSGVANLVITATASTGSVTSAVFRYKLRFLFGDPAVTEV